jgi:hypothetical protein
MAQYIDYTSSISTNKSSDYTTAGNYNDNMPTIPSSSLLKLTVAPSNTKFFQATPSFQQRLDSFRIPQPASYEVSLSNSAGYNTSDSGAYASAGNVDSGSGDFQSLGKANYKMRPY